MNLIQYKEKLSQARGKADYLREKIGDTEALLKSRQNYLHSLEEAQVFLQKVAQDTQGQLRYHIRDIVQLCMDSIWESQVEFDVKFEIKRGKTEANLVFMIDGEEVSLLDGEGGGCVDIAAFGLRVAAWSLGNTRNTIVLDEAFKHLSDDLQPAAAKVIKELSDKLKIQFLQVTHRKEMIEVADRIFEVSRKRAGDYWQSEVKVR
jgi:DNA repair exonuclease SbcCD ATPase subunit